MDSESLQILKILLIGPSGAGKSALLIRYCDDEFDSESSTATIGVDFKIKKLSANGKSIKGHFMDTAGQERFRTLSNSYYRGAHGVILVYDISNRESFESMEKWFQEAEDNCIPGALTYLVGSKLDRSFARAVSYEEGEALAEEHNSGFCEVSSKTRENVKKPFVELVDHIVRSPQLMDNSSRRTQGSVLVGVSNLNMTPGCSC